MPIFEWPFYTGFIVYVIFGIPWSYLLLDSSATKIGTFLFEAILSRVNRVS